MCVHRRGQILVLGRLFSALLKVGSSDCNMSTRRFSQTQSLFRHITQPTAGVPDCNFMLNFSLWKRGKWQGTSLSALRFASFSAVSSCQARHSSRFLFFLEREREGERERERYQVTFPNGWSHFVLNLLNLPVFFDSTFWSGYCDCAFNLWVFCFVERIINVYIHC